MNRFLLALVVVSLSAAVLAEDVHVSGCRAGSDCVFYQEGNGKFAFKAIAQADAHD